MNFDIPKTTSEKEDSFDAKWYERFEKMGSFQDFEYLEGEKNQREQQKKAFLEESIRNPELGYPKLDNFDFEGKERDLLDLKAEILKEEHNETVRQLYRWKINEKLAQLRMLRSTKEGKDKRFSRYSTFIYGNPETDIFKFSISSMKKVLERAKGSDDQRISFAVKRLEESLDFNFASENIQDTAQLPNKKELSEYPSKEEAILNAEQIAQEFESALKGLEAEGWKVVIDENVTNISVSQEKKHVKVPENRQMSETDLRGLVAHEIGTHVARRENGERSRLRLLGLGLDRYLKGEEGISTYEEQKIKGANDFAGFDGHLAISLARGLDGTKRDFRDVFNILRDYFFIRSNNADRDKAWEAAKNSAWNISVRTFRGTSCSAKGTCLDRDIVYREGNIAIWNLVKSGSDETKRFSIGKYDPTNPRHIWILEQLGITDEDLETLDSSLASDKS